MYAYIQGMLVEKTPTSVVVEAGGLGYLLQIPVSTYSALPALGENVRLLTHFLVREDAHILCGFAAADERDLFRLLISISGIGAKTALAALSGVPAAELKRAIADGAVEILTSIPGIGRKTAERIVVELRERMILDRGRAGAAQAGAKAGGRDDMAEDSVQALVSLGYKKQNARSAVDKVIRESGTRALSVEEMIRASLKIIN
jgi:Holliday junction DNA helicase RuvA